jgi:hypothetical protein
MESEIVTKGDFFFFFKIKNKNKNKKKIIPFYIYYSQSPIFSAFSDSGSY